jgi:hypothetical protein
MQKRVNVFEKWLIEIVSMILKRFNSLEKWFSSKNVDAFCMQKRVRGFEKCLIEIVIMILKKV